MCRLLVLPGFVAVAVVVAAALYFDLKGHSVMTYMMEKSQMYKFVCSETSSDYKNVPVLLRGTFYTYSVSEMKLSSMNENMKNHEYFVI